MKTNRILALLLTPLLLGGCLLPQPDTPPVGLAPNKSAAGRSTSTGTLIPQPDTPPVTPVQTVTGGASATTGSSGTLLPQPDTPPVGIAPVSSAAGVSTDSSAGTLAPNATAQPAIAQGDGRLTITLTGDAVTAVAVVDAATGATVQSPNPDGGSFGVDLPPGRYQLVLTVNGKLLRVEDVFTTVAAQTQAYAIAVHGTTATVSQDVTLTDEPATGAASSH